MSSKPKVVIILSGKRKSGKDYITNLIKSRLNDLVKIVHISEPIKYEYSKIHKLNFNNLMSNSRYKEKYRQDMVNWSEAEKLNRKDPNYFLKLALKMNIFDNCEKNANKPIWLIADARRLSDVNYFQQSEFKESQIITIRINTLKEVREKRGWVFVSGIDDAETECGLDNYQNWTYLIANDGENSKLITTLDVIIEQIKALSN